MSVATSLPTPASVRIIRPHPLLTIRREPWQRPFTTVLLAVILLAIGAPAVWSMIRKPSLALSVGGQGGQLRISWNRGALGHGASLDIADGPNRTSMFVPRGFASLTYIPVTSDVEIHMSAVDDERTEIVRSIISRTSGTEQIRHGIEATAMDVRTARTELAQDAERIATLQKEADQLVRRTQPHRSAPVRPSKSAATPTPKKNSSDTHWWR